MAHFGGGPTRWATGTVIYLIQSEKTFSQAILLLEKLPNSGKNRVFYQKTRLLNLYDLSRINLTR